MASSPAAFDRTPLPTLSCSFNNSGPEGSPWSPVRGIKPIRGSVAERLLDIRDPDELAVDGPSGGGDATLITTVLKYVLVVFHLHTLLLQLFSVIVNRLYILYSAKMVW